MSSFKEVAKGSSYIFKGFGFFARHKVLWVYAVIPTLINILAMAGMVYLFGHYVSDLFNWIFGAGSKTAAATGVLDNIWHYTLVAVVSLGKVFVSLLALLLILLAGFVLSMILSGPFNDAISEKTEQILTGHEIPFSWRYFFHSIWRSIVVELQKAGFFLLIPLLLLVLNLIPVIGNIAYIVLTGLFATFDIGFNFADYPMSRKLMPFSKRIAFARKNKYLLIGFGSIALIPFFTFLFSAPMVAGGTLLYCDRGIRG